ncbi:hypothetical protein [Leucobacter denitrificans]
MTVVPLIGIFSATESGILIAVGDSAYSIGLQVLRTAIPAIVILVWREVPLLVLPFAFIIGELSRYLFLVRRRSTILRRYDAVQSGELLTKGMIWQSLSAATSQGAPVIDRVFLSNAPIGSVSTYELADKLYYAALQFLNYGFLVRRVGRWSRLPQLSRVDAKKLLRKDLFFLGITAAVLSAIGASALLCAMLLPLPDLWRTSASWAIVLLLSLPASIIIMSASRLLIIARRQRLLLWFSLLTLVTNLTLNAIFFTLLGPFGIILATICTRFVSLIAYGVVLWRIAPTISEI